MALPLILALAPIVLGAVGGIKHMVPPVGRLMDQGLNSIWPNEIPDPYTLADQKTRNILSPSEYEQSIRKHGYDALQAERLEQLRVQRLGLTDYISLYRRGEITEIELEARIRRLGFTDESTEIILKASEYFPNVQDLIRFAVREVYSPEVIQKFNLEEALPDDFVREAQRAGVPPEQARNFWMSHWMLPSVGQGFEMLHRRVIDEDTLDLLMRTQDIMPFWREKLKEISYNPLTRVDVRRMYSMKVLGRDDVYKNYLDIGYSPENAELMTEFTVRFENEEYDGITRASAVNAYVDDIIDRSQLQEILEGIGYGENVVNFWLANADYEKTVQTVKRYTDYLTDLYRLGELSLSDVQNELRKVDVPDTYVQSVTRQLIEKRARERQLPTKSDVIDWLKKRIIDENEFNRYMLRIGYESPDIINYLSEIAIDQNTKDRKFLSDTVYVRWYETGIITEDQFIETMTLKGIKDTDIQRYIAEIEGKKNENS